MAIELTKQYQVKSRKFDSESGIFEGYAAVFGNVDSDGDIIEKGAFKKFLSGDWSRVKIMALHNDQWLPVGKPIEMYEDDVGLYIKARITKTAMGEDIWKLLKDGVLDELSIGYMPLDSFMDTNGYRHLTEIELGEVSIVTWAANEKAKILDVKARVAKSEFSAGDLLKLAGLLEDFAAELRQQSGGGERPPKQDSGSNTQKSYGLSATVSSAKSHKRKKF